MQCQMTVTPVSIVPKPSIDLVRRVTDRLDAFNRERAPTLQGERLFAVAGTRDALLGGGVAWMYGGWCELDTLWVEEPARRLGLGARILRVIEQEAARQGCFGMHTDTFSFQALPFYRAQGYQVFGELAGFTDGNTRYYLKKRLA